MPFTVDVTCNSSASPAWRSSTCLREIHFSGSGRTTSALASRPSVSPAPIDGTATSWFALGPEIRSKKFMVG